MATKPDCRIATEAKPAEKLVARVDHLFDSDGIELIRRVKLAAFLFEKETSIHSQVMKARENMFDEVGRSFATNSTNDAEHE